LLNLAINARDAMPGGGILTIETAHAFLDETYARANGIDPGNYVMLAVSDTGTGMPPEVLARVFEPFFTTKEVGKGSGLGLPMVYGFMKQSGGHVRIYSEVGHGTTVRLYLPPEPSAAAFINEESAAPLRLPSGDETILVVEDDEQVRQLATGRLSALGYRVVECADGPSALAVLEAGQPIDLLFTDVVMPGGMNGRELAEQARRRRPALKVLFTSGYAEAALTDRGAVDGAFQILTKPYSKSKLAEKIRATLG
jgi:CheY-like chemotaxis protein